MFYGLRSFGEREIRTRKVEITQQRVEFEQPEEDKTEIRQSKDGKVYFMQEGAVEIWQFEVVGEVEFMQTENRMV